MPQSLVDGILLNSHKLVFPVTGDEIAMAEFLTMLTPVLMVVVAIILLLGLWNMMRGGSPNRSQTLMRLRILAQAVAVVVMMTALYFSMR